MSHRGKALGGRYRGIYEKELEDGSSRYTVLIKFRKANGKPGYKTQTATTLREAVAIRKQAIAKRSLGHYREGLLERVTMGQMVKLMRAMKANYSKPVNMQARLREILAFFGAATPLDRIDETHIQAFREYLDQRKKLGNRQGFLSAGSKNRILQEIRHLLRTARDKGYLRHVPQIQLYRDLGRRNYSLSLPRFWRLLAHIPAPPNPHRAMLLMGLVTGQRKSDLLGMKRDQVKGDLIRFKSSKTGKEFLVACPERLAKALARLPAIDSPWLFPNPVTAQPYTDITAVLARASAKAGIDPPVTLHMVRHLAADELMKVTGNAMFVQQYIGWSSPAMVERYTHAETWTAPIVAKLAQRMDETAAEHQAETNRRAGQGEKGCTQVDPTTEPTLNDPNTKSRKRTGPTP